MRNSFTSINSQAPFPVSVRLSELLQVPSPCPVASTRSPLKCTNSPARKDLHCDRIFGVAGIM